MAEYYSRYVVHTYVPSLMVEFGERLKRFSALMWVAVSVPPNSSILFLSTKPSRFMRADVARSLAIWSDLLLPLPIVPSAQVLLYRVETSWQRVARKLR